MSSPFKTFAVHTFGCKVNFADSSMISRKLIESGFSYVNSNEIADIYVVNTCSVTEKADKKADKFIKNIKLKYPESKIIITGCYAQLDSENLKKKSDIDLITFISWLIKI